MPIKPIILSIAIAAALHTPQTSLAGKTVTTTKDFVDSIKNKLQSKRWSCIVDNRYRSRFYIDNYHCGKTEDLKQEIIRHPNYPHLVFDVMWHYKRGEAIKDKSKEDKVLFGLNIELVNHKTPKDTPVKRVFIINDNSKYLWKVLKDHTCFLVYGDKIASIKNCK